MTKSSIGKRLIGLLTICLSLLVGNFFSGCRSRGTANLASEASYRRFLAISQVESYYHTEPKTKVRYPLIQGSLTNLGSETLMVVEFTLRFKDNLHRVIHEEHAYPVYHSTFFGPSPTEALEPGQKTRFAFKSAKCPATWQPGQVDIEVTKVIFLQSARLN